jgi:hypothetical protein
MYFFGAETALKHLEKISAALTKTKQQKQGSGFTFYYGVM